MTRPARPPLGSALRVAEAVGPRPSGGLNSEFPRLSPCATARRLLHEGKPHRALELLEKELACGQDTIDLQYWLGRAAFQLGDYFRAQRALFRASILAPDDDEVRRWLARVLLRSGNAVGAMRVLARASRSRLSSRAEDAAALLNGDETADLTDDAYSEPPTSDFSPARRRFDPK